MYNLYKPEGSRVVDLQVLCTKCRVPEYVPIEDSTSYQFIAPAFIVSGGDGYSMIKKHMTKHHIFGKNENLSDLHHYLVDLIHRAGVMEVFRNFGKHLGYPKNIWPKVQAQPS